MIIFKNLNLNKTTTDSTVALRWIKAGHEVKTIRDQ